MKIVLTGATGLVGSRFFDLLKAKYEIIPLSSSYGVDITDKKEVFKFLKEKKPALIVHLAAKTNVDVCEQDMEMDLKRLKEEKVYKDEVFIPENIDEEYWRRENSAFAINVVGTKNLGDYARESEIDIIYISTDFVFRGEKDEPYTEEDATNPVNWYGQTKLFGEQVLPQNSLTCRISYPFGFRSAIKKDLVWTLYDLLTTKETVSLVSDQIITPTFIDDIVMGLDLLINMQAKGLVNLVGNNFLSPYEIGVAVAREFNIREIKIERITRSQLYEGRAPRPFKVTLKNDKLRALGFVMTDFYQVLKMIR